MTPTGSCPMTRPLLTGYSPRTMCRSVPQIVVSVMRMMASPTPARGRSTSSTRMSFTPWKTVARIFAISGPPSLRVTRVLCFDHPIALAGGRLKPAPVEDGHLPPCVANHLLFLEKAGGPRHYGTGHAEHHRQELVLHLELAPRRVVVRHQQPAREALVHGMRADAGRRLRDLCEERVTVASQHVWERAAPPEFVSERPGLHAHGAARQLYECAGRGRLRPKRHRGA